MQKEIVFLVALIILVVLLASAVKVFETNVEQADAKKFVLADLNDKYPGADSEIISMEEKQNEQTQKYFHIKAKVTNNANAGCPQRMHVYYNYPEQNFEPEPVDYITSKCEVCREQPCVLAFPEEAIIASHTLPGSSKIDDFLSLYPTAYPLVEGLGNGWKVMWDSPVSSYYYVAEVATDGKIKSVARFEKEA